MVSVATYWFLSEDLSPAGFDGAADLLMLQGFVVQSNDAPFMRSLLTEEIKGGLLRYQEGLEIVFGRIDLKNSLSSSSALDQGPGCFFFALKKIATDDSDYDALIETSIRFHERLKAMARRGLGNV